MTAIPLSRTIEYPESDGQPMAETPAQGQVILDLYHALSQRYAAVPDVYVWFNMFLYYVEGNPRASVAPDVFVAWGVDKKRQRRTYKVWEEGRAPSWICEVTSKSTRDEDTVTKKGLYEHLGVEEYFLFDPQGEYLKPRLQGYRLVGGRYQRLAAQADGSLPSQTTGLQLVPEGERLRLRDAATGAPLPWQEEDAAARAGAERQAEEARRARADAERDAVQQAQRADQEARKAEEERRARAAAERQAEEARRARAVAERDAVQQAQRADQETQRADQEAQRADQEAQRADQGARKAEEERRARAAAEQRTRALEEELARLRRGDPGR